MDSLASGLKNSRGGILGGFALLLRCPAVRCAFSARGNAGVGPPGIMAGFFFMGRANFADLACDSLSTQPGFGAENELKACLLIKDQAKRKISRSQFKMEISELQKDLSAPVPRDAINPVREMNILTPANSRGVI